MNGNEAEEEGKAIGGYGMKSPTVCSKDSILSGPPGNHTE